MQMPVLTILFIRFVIRCDLIEKAACKFKTASRFCYEYNSCQLLLFIFSFVLQSYYYKYNYCNDYC